MPTSLRSTVFAANYAIENMLAATALPIVRALAERASAPQGIVDASTVDAAADAAQAEVQADSLASVLYGVCAFASIVCAAAFSLLHRSYPTDRRSANPGKRLALGGRPGSIV